MRSKNNPTKKKVHIIGICGAGMSALAIMLKEKGYRVSGSDHDVFGLAPLLLRQNKIPFHVSHRKSHVPKDASMVIVGNHAGLAPEENEETKQAIKLRIPVKSMPAVLAELSEETENIIVAGSFGKSTMTSLLAWCLHHSRKDPSYFVGARPIDLPNPGHIGHGPNFVLEGDEYTSAYFDQGSKFLHFRPTSVVLISAEHDHVNKFPTVASYIAPYKKLVEKIPKDGLLIYSLHGKNNGEIARSASGRQIRYSADDNQADWYGENIKYGKISSFDLMRNGKKVAKIKTRLLGRHNIENIVGAGATLLEEEKMTPQAFARAVEKFNGIHRRIELKNPKAQIPVYEIFGSSYDKTRAGYEALRLHFPKKRIITVFEPHAFSWRNRTFLPWYKNIFEGMDEVIMLPAVSRGKNAQDQLETKDIWEETRKYFPIHTATTEKETLTLLKKIAKKGDVVALVSSGPMLGLTESVPKLFKR